jgi:hypothetical protein
MPPGTSRHPSMKPVKTARRPTLTDRIGLWLSISRRIDGLWIGTTQSGDKAEAALRRVEAALNLIKIYDRLRYDRLHCDIERVWVVVLLGALGSYNERLRACQLDPRHVLAEDSTPEVIAATIVHEATHARLQRCGIGYEEERRSRIEAVCFRREAAFAMKLPNGGPVREMAERQLGRCTTNDCWTDAAFYDRFPDSAADALRYLGGPEWLVRLLVRRWRRRQRRH